MRRSFVVVAAQDDVNIQVQMATATRAAKTIADDRRSRPVQSLPC
ncbi:MAG TPA: hypothetical protein VLV78_18630 [Thermoanaerobaculia bacterium]|nr:hypothetical protein [Thermoanaerobaculia bacterium]